MAWSIIVSGLKFMVKNMVIAYKNGYRIFVSVTHMSNPLEINRIVKSLKFS